MTFGEWLLFGGLIILVSIFIFDKRRGRKRDYEPLLNKLVIVMSSTLLLYLVFIEGTAIISFRVIVLMIGIVVLTTMEWRSKRKNRANKVTS
ncbi:hypothetical protein [Alkalibacillus haloalkaliphilus]|uniref:hypothetical protein n=1 Tax=Alkalibacillus haloalkaliphilus TaxID=94136 RepID=UPI002935F40C|nr:hypothetical protein [Alkalibacillus haloalkaliphilus]MDV2582903.1 hypothetical protein [Alkalibacillus haloalkaliphilus]